jgi:hypothetical protein
MSREAVYQAQLVKKIQDLFPDCFILKNDPSEIQGIPDILILIKDRWAMLEVKLSKYSPRRSNQQYYIDVFNSMSYAAFVYPENEEQVLNDLQFAFGIGW